MCSASFTAASSILVPAKCIIIRAPKGSAAVPEMFWGIMTRRSLHVYTINPRRKKGMKRIMIRLNNKPRIIKSPYCCGSVRETTVFVDTTLTNCFSLTEYVSGLALTVRGV